MKIDYQQLEFLHPKLRQLMKFVEDQTGLEFTITSLYRMNDNGVHGTLPVRGCDLRMRDSNIGASLQQTINSYWEYDASRPEKVCAICHGKGYNLHLHLQVHDNTDLLI